MRYGEGVEARMVLHTSPWEMTAPNPLHDGQERRVGALEPGGLLAGYHLGLDLLRVGSLEGVLGRTDRDTSEPHFEDDGERRHHLRRFGLSLNSPRPVWTTRPPAFFDSL
jgi:hypothetical protein